MKFIAAVLVSVAVLALKPAAAVITVSAGGDLQRALNGAVPGDTILLEPGATYVGNFYLPRRAGNDTRPITLRTAPINGADAVASGERITPAQAGALAKLKSPDNMPALSTEPGARSWTIQLLEFVANRDGAGDIIALGDASRAQKSLADVPSDLVLDRLYVHGDPRLGQKRGVALNSGRTTISNSYISDIKTIGQDSQAIGGSTGPGDYTIENNYLEAAGENIIFGGNDPAIPDLVPTHIVIRRNVLTKPLEWRDPALRWQVKNLFELKNARDVLIEGNVMEHNWQAAQSGYAILFTVRNQDGGCPWCVIEDVRFTKNIVRDIAAGISILGLDNNHPSLQVNRISITNNVFDGIDNRRWGGDGYFMQVLASPRQLTIDHNTIIQGSSNGVAKISDRVDGFVFTNNIAAHGLYGIIGDNHGVGNDSIRAFLSGSTIAANVIAGGNRSVYPPGNFFPSMDEFRAQFVDFDAHDFRIRAGSAWTTASTDGRGLGADLTRLPKVPEREAPTRPRKGSAPAGLLPHLNDPTTGK
jgi:hypothetical protein